MSQNRTRIPTPLYAAAGVGDLAYERVRQLPELVTELTAKTNVTSAELREKAAATTVELREKAAATLRSANTAAEGLRTRAAAGEIDREWLRTTAIRNAAVLVAGAQTAQERARAAYDAMVTRGERVIGSGVVRAADTVNADMEVTEPVAVTATSAEPTAVTATPAEVAEVEPAPAAKPVSTSEPVEVAAAEPEPARKSAAKATKRVAAKTVKPAVKATKPTVVKATKPTVVKATKPTVTKATKPAAKDTPPAAE